MKAMRAMVVAASAVLLVGLASCGSDSDSSSDTAGGADTTAAAAETTAATTAATGAETTTGGSEAPASAGEPVTLHIAHIADLTGPAKAANEAQVRGMDLALEKLTADGSDISIDRRDTSGDIARATATMTETANDDSVQWQFGPANTGEFFAAIPIAEQLEMPISSISSGGVYTEEFPEWVFRTSFAENAATDALIDYIQSDLGATKIAAAYANDNDFARTSAEYFIGQAEDAGIEFTAKPTFSTQDINYSTQAAEIASSNPEAVYLATNVNAGLVVKALRDAGVEAPIVGTNNTFHTPKDVFDTSGGATEGIFFVGPYDPNDPRPVVTEFLDAYHAKYPGTEPGIQDALGYDALMILATAAQGVDGEITRESLRDAFANVQYEGVTGANISFPDGKGDAKREGIHILTIEAPGVAVSSN